ncbi:hypothetical protein CHS0354_030794 [Potamilus streckersoni]|uniref:G-patch domain-containing protein n=1 Tax=Potamilus streckersoni TaxID=2493646 RepID=A0AAE0WBQ0_9BIVA|nr:hypothetical protein CHS0354_030794 [Potamilus streckersoni]
MEDGNTVISFGFSKKSEAKKLKRTDIAEKDDDKEETEYILSLEDKEVKSTKPKEVKKDLVIPLLKANNWRNKNEENKKPKDELESRAVEELLADTERQNREWEESGQRNQSLQIPLLMQNRVPEGFETDDRLDVSLRPDEPEEADYDEIPIEQYGLAVLRGMGWKEEEGIGKTNKRSVVPVDAVLRPKGMGLGADRSQANTLNASKVGGGKSEVEEQLVLKKGTHCFIQKGSNKDLYGMIEGIDEDNARVMIKLALSSKVVTVSQYAVKLVTAKEFNKYSKYLNKGKADKYKEEEEKRNRRREEEDSKESRHRKNDQYKSDQKSHGSREDGLSEEKHKEKNRESSERKRKKENSDDDSKSSKSANGHSSTSSSSIWVRTQMRVRLIDKNFLKGKYYKSKVIVEDVLDKDRCVCKTEDGKVLDIPQSMMETVIPKSEPAHVVIVSGKHRGQVAEIIEKDRRKCEALVQLLSDRDQVLRLDFDSICEFVGNIHEEFDY